MRDNLHQIFKCEGCLILRQLVVIISHITNLGQQVSCINKQLHLSCSSATLIKIPRKNFSVSWMTVS